jgi:hypothetical protein
MRGEIMATEGQLEFVKDIEAAVTAILMDRKPVGITVSEIMEMAGRNSHQISPTVKRLTVQGEVELLKRIQAAFEKAGLKQTTIDKAIARLEGGEPELQDEPEAEPLKLDRTIPAPEKPILVHVNRSPVQSDRKTLDKVLEILEPLPKTSQAKIISSAAVWLGVAE